MKGFVVNPLITDEERRQLLAHGQARAAGQAIDPLPVVRLFTPDAHATWLLAVLDPADGDTAWGLIDLGIGMPELGTVKLSDLAGIVGPRHRPIQRDLYFRASRPLSEYVRRAQIDGSIPDLSIRMARCGGPSRHRPFRRIVSFLVWLMTLAI